MSKLYSVKRNGEEKMRVSLEKHSDGTMWNGKNPLFDAESEGFKKLGKEKILEFVKAGKIAEIPADCFAHEGMSPTGLEVISFDEIYAKQDPSQIERARIAGMYAKARSISNGNSEENVSLPMMLISQADAALAKWCKDFPQDALTEKKAKMIAEAEHQEELANGALVFDMDGSISPEMQKNRFDEFMAKANKIREEANNLK